MAAITAWLVLYLVAVAAYPGYDPVGNFLSDLGHPRAPGAWAFNLGAVVAGALFVPYALTIGALVGGHGGLLGGVWLASAAAFLALVGIFPEGSPNNLHLIVSAIFFLLQGLGAATLALPMHRSERFGPVAGILAGAIVAASVAFLASGAEPVLEHVVVFTSLIWTAWVAGRILRSRT